MRRPLVAGNWKMNGSREAIDLLLDGLSGISTTAEVAVFPPYVYLPQVVSTLCGSGIDVGAQNVSEYQAGAYTGEVAADMLLDIGCRYVLVGHSERRSLFGEKDRQVAAKFVASQRSGLIPVLCVGETLEGVRKDPGGDCGPIRRSIGASGSGIRVQWSDSLRTGLGDRYWQNCYRGTGTGNTSGNSSAIGRTRDENKNTLRWQC